jgi:autophagy-related protein 9
MSPRVARPLANLIAPRFVAFVAGSFASVLILFTLLDPDAFLHFDITKDRSVLFYITIFGSILAVARGMIPEDHRVTDPEKLMLEVAEHTHWMPEEWRGRLHSTEVHAEFSQLFQMKITTFATELLSVLTTPLVFWYTLPRRAPHIIDFFREFTIHVDGLGHVCSFGVFDFKRRGGEMPAEEPRATTFGTATNEGKLDKSLLNFKSAYPEWQPREDTTSLYLSHLQAQSPAFGRRSMATRFGAPLASTTLMADDSTTQRDQENKARAYERAFQRAGARSVTKHAPTDDCIAEEGLDGSYGDTRTGPSAALALSPAGQPVDSVVGLMKQAYSSSKNKGW